MARKKPTKSHAIREYLKTDLNAGPTKVVQELKKKGVTVPVSLVSNVKSRLLAKDRGAPKRGRKRRGLASTPRGRRPNSEMVAISGLLEARNFANRVGSVDKAVALLQTLAKINR